MAKELNVSSETIIAKIRKLVRSNIIQHYMVFLNNLMMGQNYYKVLIGLHNISEEDEIGLMTYCQKNPNIIYAVKTMGEWDLEIDIEVEGVINFRRIMRDFVNNFSNIIRDYSSLNIYEEYKFNFFEKI